MIWKFPVNSKPQSLHIKHSLAFQDKIKSWIYDVFSTLVDAFTSERYGALWRLQNWDSLVEQVTKKPTAFTLFQWVIAYIPTNLMKFCDHWFFPIGFHQPILSPPSAASAPQDLYKVNFFEGIRAFFLSAFFSPYLGKIKPKKIW